MSNKNWYKIYSEKIDLVGPLNYLSQKVREKNVLVNKVTQNTPRGGKIIEMGCGTAVLSTHLQNLGYEVIALDMDQAMLNLAQKIARNFKLAPTFVRGDVICPDLPEKSFDTSFSNGVLEHFSDEEIVKSIKAQSQLCKRVIFSIPSTYFREHEKIYGNERFLSRKKWEELIGRSDMNIIDDFEFTYRGDNILENSIIRARSLLSGVKPYVGFVLKSAGESK